MVFEDFEHTNSRRENQQNFIALWSFVFIFGTVIDVSLFETQDVWLMKYMRTLVKGYRSDLSADDRKRLHALAEYGQSPKIMLIACADSRISPSMIFDAKPGELFVVRNVANLVPPYERDEAHHGTSAAIEFAVKSLHVEHIIVMGHSLCGGVKACCQGVHVDGAGALDGLEFVPKWTSILNACAKDALDSQPDASLDTLVKIVEHDAIRVSLSNLRAFPFVQDGLRNGSLDIHGAYFDIGDAMLYALDQDRDAFLPLE